MYKTCFFIGHRDTPQTVMSLLIEAVERHVVEYDVTGFTVGHYGDFDKLAAKAVKDAKQRHPEVTLTLLLPYHPADHPIPTPDGFDDTFYPPEMEKVPKRFAIVRANRWMIQHSDFLISYVQHPASNARELLEYAQRREKKNLIHVENLSETQN